MKQLLLFVASIPLLAQGTLSLSNPGPIPPAGYAPGATVTLSVPKVGNPGATGLQFDLAAPQGVASFSVAAGPAVPAGKITTCSTGLNIRCLIFGAADTNSIPDGVVAVVTVTLATLISSSPVNVAISNPIEADKNGASLPTTILNPTVSLSIRNGCDVNGDGSISSADSSAVASQAITKVSTTATDLNSDTKTDILDVQIAATAATPPSFICNAH